MLLISFVTRGGLLRPESFLRSTTFSASGVVENNRSILGIPRYRSRPLFGIVRIQIVCRACDHTFCAMAKLLKRERGFCRPWDELSSEEVLRLGNEVVEELIE